MKSRFIWVMLFLFVTLPFSVTSHAKVSELVGAQHQVGKSPSVVTVSEKPSKDSGLQTETFVTKVKEESKDTDDWKKKFVGNALMVIILAVIFGLILYFQEQFFWIIVTISIVAVLLGLNELGLFDFISDILDKVKSFFFT